MDERRLNSAFVERLSLILIIGSLTAALLILLDPVITFTLLGDSVDVKIGGDGFSEQLKGAVISAIIISGFSGVISYWLGASKSGDKAQESVNTIAQNAAPNQAAAVAAQAINAGGAPQRPLSAEEIQAAAIKPPVTN